MIKISAVVFFIFCCFNSNAQYTSYKISPKGDTLNAIDKKGLKQGKWVISVGEKRGEPGYDEEGVFKNGEKNGIWRKYNVEGDIIAMENYRNGGKDGVQEYFNFTGDIERHEEWRGYDPDAPYDTIAVYGAGNNEIISYKIVKAEQYSVPHGNWMYYASGGMLIRSERYDRGHIQKPELEVKPETEETAGKPQTASATPAKPKEKVKTQEMLDYEKKYSKKKRAHMERNGQTGL